MNKCPAFEKFEARLGEILADNSESIEPFVVQQIRGAMDEIMSGCVDEEVEQDLPDREDLKVIANKLGDALKGFKYTSLTFVCHDEGIALVSRSELPNDPFKIVEIIDAIKKGSYEAAKSIIEKNPKIGLLYLLKGLHDAKDEMESEDQS